MDSPENPHRQEQNAPHETPAKDFDGNAELQRLREEFQMKMSQVRLKIAERNKRFSPLLALPPELRNRVYAFTLGGHTYRFNHTRFAMSIDKEENPLRFLRTCRQINAGATGFALKDNVFSFHARHASSLWDDWLWDMYSWQLENITTLEIISKMSWSAVQGARVQTVFEYEGITLQDIRSWNLPNLKRVNVRVTRPARAGSTFKDTVNLDKKKEAFRQLVKEGSDGAHATVEFI